MTPSDAVRCVRRTLTFMEQDPNAVTQDLFAVIASLSRVVYSTDPPPLPPPHLTENPQ
ncbi:Hypothetical protein SMAX5B_022726 [Scophthalmus maximus]|uniref:Uncharacterized protein n=1 Tax=Scophthalmus maximus TaxID=52904 RepID=A0A2U9BDG4_SCOMX|nr:Hypothetical protein SMAX5B_022726 [Scophthalmus maximus]